MSYFSASVDALDDNRKFAESLDLDYPILSDPGKQVAAAYGVVNSLRPYAQRWTFYIGKDGKILYIDKNINVASAGKDVADRLVALGVEKRK